MRTIAGLIVGVALGILLMYFTVSTAKVGRLTERRPAPLPTATAAPIPATVGTPSLAARLGEAAGTAAAAALAGQANVLLVGDSDDPLVADALRGFRQVMAARPETTVVEVSGGAAAIDRLSGMAAVFCPDHGQLQAWREQAGGKGFPPVYTVGWSEWLVGACGVEPPPVVGVAVVAPAAAVRQATPQAASGMPSMLAQEPLPAVVLSPAQFAAAFALPGSILPSTPAAEKP